MRAGLGSFRRQEVTLSPAGSLRHREDHSREKWQGCQNSEHKFMQVDEGGIAEALERRLGVKPGALLFVQTTAPLKRLPRLCSKFRCFTRDSVWKDRSDQVSGALPSCLTDHCCSKYRGEHSYA